jgi:hypothetical protein
MAEPSETDIAIAVLLNKISRRLDSIEDRLDYAFIEEPEDDDELEEDDEDEVRHAEIIAGDFDVWITMTAWANYHPTSGNNGLEWKRCDDDE